MTTPEKLRRRQRQTGIFLIVLALLSITYSVWDSAVARERDACVARSFSTNAEIQQTKSDLAQRASALQAQIDANQDRSNRIQDQVIKDVAAATTEADVLAAFAEFNRRTDGISEDLIQLQQDQAALLVLRRETKVPPFPTGKCD